jgi:hypothetical protein
MTSPKEGWKSEFDEKFDRIVQSQGGFIVGKKGTKYDNCAYELQDIKVFLEEVISRAEEGARKEERERCIDIHHKLMEDHGHKKCNCFRASVYEDLSAPSER